jgi:hypothetical protein
MEPFFVTGALVGTGICIVEFTRREHSERSEKESKQKEMFEQIKKERYEKFEEMKKNSNKHRFITSFIDEIPELSYYEAKQLHKKLGSIYVEWNDD